MNTSLKQTFYKRLSVILIASVIVVSALVIRLERLLLSEDLKDKGTSIASILSSVTLDAILSHDYATLERYTAEIVREKFVSGIAVIRYDGQVLAGERLEPATDTLLVEQPIRLGNQEFGLIQLAFSTSRIDAIAWRTVVAAAAVIAILHILGFFLTNLVLGQTVLKPLAGLRQAIRTLASGDFSEQLNTSGPKEFRDISDSFNTMAGRLRQSFTEIQQSRQELDVEQKKLAAIVASIADGLFVTDDNGVISSFNASAARISGYPEKEAIGRKCSELFQSSLCQDACALYNSGETRENIETYLVTKDGRRLEVSVSSAVILSQNGEWIGGVQTFRDITLEKKQHELYCRTEKLAALGQLAAGIAHEINNPLGNIIGYARQIKAGTAAEKIGERVEVIVEQARKCSHIVKGLLDYSRASVSEPRRLDLNNIVRKVVAVLDLQREKKEVNIALHLGEIPPLVADERKVEQLVMNLALNGVQAVGQGGTVTISTWLQGKSCTLLVEDDGPGIPTELRCRIFDPFFTTKPVGVGTGLGLSICVGIVDELHGSIEVLDRTGGATFRVLLPLPVSTRGESDA
jgi:PAS domain S-box-containing protein